MNQTNPSGVEGREKFILSRLELRGVRPSRRAQTTIKKLAEAEEKFWSLDIENITKVDGVQRVIGIITHSRGGRRGVEHTLAKNKELLKTEPYATIVKKQREVIELRKMLPKKLIRALKWD